MKMLIKSIERINKAGTSKAGNPYHIDQTSITVEVPFDDENGFGYKTITYQFGKSSNFAKLEQLRGKLPIEAEIELGAELNQYNTPTTVITDLKITKQTQA